MRYARYMSLISHLSKYSVTAAFLTVWISLPVSASEEADLLEALRTADPADAARIETELLNHWSKSGSDAMDFLLKRGRDAIEINDFRTAIEHLTALTDHAPDFAEGYNLRALAYFRTEKIGPAIGDLERVLTLNPQHFVALRGLAAVFETLDDPERAHEAYQRVLDLHPNDEDAQKGLERTLLQTQGREL